MEVNVASLVSPAFDDAFWDIQDMAILFIGLPAGAALRNPRLSA